MKSVLRILSVTATLGAALPGTTGSAAEFVPGGDDTLNCELTLRGNIVPGDADRFLEALRTHVLARPEQVSGQPAPRRICLESPGGSLSEAIRMADVLLGKRSDAQGGERNRIRNLGTVVPAGATCHSACAVLFMAGGHQTESVGGRIPSRI